MPCPNPCAKQASHSERPNGKPRFSFYFQPPLREFSAAFLLGLGRAFGETMIVLMATGNAALLSGSLFDPVRTMSATIGAEMAEVVFGDAHYNVLFFIGVCLFVFSFTLNAVAEFIVRSV